MFLKHYHCNGGIVVEAAGPSHFDSNRTQQ
jgi:hypothetical protein